MSSRIKVVLLDKAGQVRDYRKRGVRNYVNTYFPGTVWTGNRAKDLKIAKELLLQLDLYLFSWKEAKEARGREQLVKIFQRELKEAQNKLISQQVMEIVRRSLSKRKLEPPVEIEEPDEAAADWGIPADAIPHPIPAPPQARRRRIQAQPGAAVQEIVNRMRARQNER